MLTPNQLRAEIVARRTYMRPLNEEGTKFESWKDVSYRVTWNHQKWLWERALGRSLNNEEKAELRELEALVFDRKALPAGRTLWLGGTETSKKREISNFNCAGLGINTVNDVVDAFWLLLNGSGVGFKPVPGCLNGFKKPIREVEVIRTTKGKDDKGREDNQESFENGVWTISIGDSGEAWAKSIGKLLSGKYDADKLVFDFSEVRGAGGRLKGYGWISSGDEVIAQVYPKIAKLLSRKAGQLLDELDILDVLNYLGVIQTGRRGAEVACVDYGTSNWERFATAKKDFWLHDNHHRTQSNNSLMFWEKPSSLEIKNLLNLMVESGGSEPGLINAAHAKERAPWFYIFNPCVESTLANKGLCNLIEINVAAFDNWNDLCRAVYIMARANYRQTQVDLNDGILQPQWHQNNEFIRLCGTSITGWAMRPDLSNYDKKVLRNLGIHGAYSMAMELGSQLPKNVTLMKPSGSVSKVMGSTEGIHYPLGRYIINNITFSRHEPIVKVLKNAGYKVFDNPSQPDGVVVAFPVSWETVSGFTNVNGTDVNLESAVTQLDRYKQSMRWWTEQNTSITVSYDESELDAIGTWMHDNWDDYVGVSFIKRADPTKTAEDLGYLYLPQEVVTKEKFEHYQGSLKSISLSDLRDTGGVEDIDFLDSSCDNGVCPIR